jgi:enoyl-CoA hydratase
MGLANACLPGATFLEGVDAWTAEIAANSPFSHAANKRLLDQTDGLPLAAGLAHEVYRGEGVGPDMREGIAAFAARNGG